MIDFGTDSEQNKVIPIIASARLEELMALNNACLYEVSRYRYSKIEYDFENIVAIDYSDVLHKEGLKRTSERLIENKAQYSEKEITYLVLRNLISYSWKLDVMFLVHLKECAEASLNWGKLLRNYAHIEGLVKGQPYWLRNDQANLLNSMEKEKYDLLSKVELMMIKSNKVFPKCSVMGTNYFVHIDSGTYPFLMEWIRVVLSGYRIREFNNRKTVVQTTEPIRTGAMLMMAVVNIIRGNKSAFLLPEQAMNFSPNDPSIAKEIVTNQIEFLLGHEYGHIYVMQKELSMGPQEEELFADKFGFDLVRDNKATLVYLGNTEAVVENDIQPDVDVDKKIEDIELLFLFYDMYFYASKLLGYKEEMDESHPYIDKRRKELRKCYSKKKKTPLLNYAEGLAKKIKRKMREQYEGN